jgi:hypothetical protein
MRPEGLHFQSYVYIANLRYKSLQIWTGSDKPSWKLLHSSAKGSLPHCFITAQHKASVRQHCTYMRGRGIALRTFCAQDMHIQWLYDLCTTSRNNCERLQQRRPGCALSLFSLVPCRIVSLGV